MPAEEKETGGKKGKKGKPPLTGEPTMKVFEVICEYCQDGSEEMVTVQQYVTSEENTLKSIVDHFTRHCLEYEKNLVGVREVLTIVQHLTGAD